MKRAGATVWIGLTSALSLVGIVVSCSTFSGEDEKDSGTTPNPEAGTDAQAEDGSTRADSADTPDVDVPEGEDAGDGGTVVVDACATTGCRVVFVTAEKYGGNLGGAAGADNLCNMAAQKVTKLAGRTFKAWISEPTSPAMNRINHANVPYQRLDKVVVANDWTDLTDGNLLAPINIDQAGVVLLGADVWTGTDTAGQATAVTCSSWRAPDSGIITGTAGRTDRADGGWTMAKTYLCGTLARLYCIESP